LAKKPIQQRYQALATAPLRPLKKVQQWRSACVVFLPSLLCSALLALFAAGWCVCEVEMKGGPAADDKELPYHFGSALPGLPLRFFLYALSS